MSRFACLLLLFVLGTPFPALGQAKAERPPNIVLIFVDDLGYGDLGVHWQNQRGKNGKPAHQTPMIDAMAHRGVQMRHTYCSAPVCAPSRASLLLGVTQGHANIRNNQFDKALEDNHTIASVLGQAGYATAAFGKWGLQGKPGPNTPNGFQAHPMNRGFDYFFGYIRHKDGHRHYPKEDKKECYDGAVNVSDKLDLSFTPDLFAARAKKWIVDQVKEDKDKPFFVYLAHDTPHAILQNPPCAYPKGGGLHGGVQWLGKPGRMINTAQGKYDAWMHPDYAKTDWPDVYKRYANLVRRIDDTVGDVNQLLEDLDIADNTLVIFTSDNGPSLESYLKEQYKPTFFKSFGPFDGVKRDVWEGGIRVGMIAQWPGTIPSGRINGEPSTFADMMATFCDAAGAPVPARSDGVSMLPSMTGKDEQKPANIYIEYDQNGKTPPLGAFEKERQGRKRGQMQAIRIGDYMGVRYDIKSHQDDFEIYKINDDPKQKQDLADKPGMAKLQQEMKDEVLCRRVVNNSAKRPYDNVPVAAIDGVKTKPGLDISFQRRLAEYVQKSDDAKSSSMTTASLDLMMNTKLPSTVLYTGYIDAPKAGLYEFELVSTERSLLRLHDATVIDNDQPFEKNKAVKASIRIEKGQHPIRLYLNTPGDGAGAVVVKWRLPGSDSFVIVPESALSRSTNKD